MQLGGTVNNGSLAGISVLKVVEANETVAVFVAAAGAADLNGVAIVNSNEGALVSSGSLSWTYLTSGLISTVTPNSGIYGTVVTIAGSNLLGNGSKLESITLNGAIAQIVSQTTIQVVVVAANSNNVGSGHVILTSDTGAVINLVGGFTYLENPSITSITPAIEPLATTINKLSFANTI